jgi:hypothetical protein
MCRCEYDHKMSFSLRLAALDGEFAKRRRRRAPAAALVVNIDRAKPHFVLERPPAKSGAVFNYAPRVPLFPASPGAAGAAVAGSNRRRPAVRSR